MVIRVLRIDIGPPHYPLAEGHSLKLRRYDDGRSRARRCDAVA